MYFSGRVHSVVYDEPVRAFYILKMVLDTDPTLGPNFLATVRGNISGLSVKVGSWFGFEAEWTAHPEYGKQLNILKAPVFKDWDPTTVEQILIGYGVGGKVLQQIRMAVGDIDFIKILSDAEAMQKRVGLDAFTAQYVVQRWQTVQAYFKSLTFLNELGLQHYKVQQIWEHFGDDSVKILSSNPWALVQIEGITFQQADEIADRLQLPKNSPDRIKGALVFVCQSALSDGHLFLTLDQALNSCRGLIPEVDKTQVALIIADSHKAGDLTVDNKTKPGVSAVYTPKAWQMEDVSAELLRKRQVSASFEDGGLLNKDDYMVRLSAVGPDTQAVWGATGDLARVVTAAVDEWGSYEQLVLSPDQKTGVINALKEPVSILTGLPGTGKTTSLQAVVRILQEAKVPFLLCAPTGIAAKRLSELTKSVAYTIHRAFAARGSSDDKRETTYAGIVGDAEIKIGGFDKDGVWGYGSGNTHPADIVIVDESSMVDQHLLYRLLTCTSDKCRLVFVGDAAQLPSVGPGNVLRDLIASGKFPTVNLTQIFRQKSTNSIVHAAHAIFKGEVPACTPPSEFALYVKQGDDATLDAILQIAQKLYESREEFQILSPRHSGTVGVTNLNARLRELLNPARSGLQEIRRDGDVIREDDRIMITKNNYQLGVYNGDVGKVARIVKKDRSVELKIFGPSPLIISMPIRDWSSYIRMAYACTVHKAQGLEYDYIVMPIVDNFRHQLQRNLLYTAVTRARKKVLLVGSLSALTTAVLNNKEDLRNTLLKERLQIVVTN